MGTPDQLRTGREFAAWVGLTSLNRSSGGKERLGKISKTGDRYLRRLLVLTRNEPYKSPVAVYGRMAQVDDDTVIVFGDMVAMRKYME